MTALDDLNAVVASVAAEVAKVVTTVQDLVAKIQAGGGTVSDADAEAAVTSLNASLAALQGTDASDPGAPPAAPAA